MHPHGKVAASPQKCQTRMYVVKLQATFGASDSSRSTTSCWKEATAGKDRNPNPDCGNRNCHAGRLVRLKASSA
jgi:hypothetical protein